MSRPLRLEFPYAVYYVTSRGNARQKIVRDDRDRTLFLDILAGVVMRYGWLCHAYCLLGKHYHLLIETPKPNLSLGMRQLNGVYTQAFNRRHRQGGHLFQGRFKAILVEKDAYLLDLSRHIVLNPIRVKLAKRPQQWRWSSYRATAGVEQIPAFLTIDGILTQFGKQRRVAQRRYQQFVAEGMTRSNPWDSLRGQMYLGGDQFVAKHQPGRFIPEIPRQQTLPYRPSLHTIFRRKIPQDQVILEAYRRYGYRLREIADYLGVHYTSVSRWLKRAEGDLK